MDIRTKESIRKREAHYSTTIGQTNYLAIQILSNLDKHHKCKN